MNKKLEKKSEVNIDLEQLEFGIFSVSSRNFNPSNRNNIFLFTILLLQASFEFSSTENISMNHTMTSTLSTINLKIFFSKSKFDHELFKHYISKIIEDAFENDLINEVSDADKDDNTERNINMKKPEGSS